MKLEHFFMIRYNYCHGTGLKGYTVVFIHNFGRKPPWSKLWTHKGKTKFRCSHFSTYTCDIPLDYWVAFIINKRSPAKEGFKIWSNIPCLEKDQMPQKSSLISIDHDMLFNQNPYLHAILCEPGRLDLITVFHIPTLLLPWQRHPGLAVIAFAVWVSVSGLCVSEWLTARFLMLLQCAAYRNG